MHPVPQEPQGKRALLQGMRPEASDMGQTVPQVRNRQAARVYAWNFCDDFKKAEDERVRKMMTITPEEQKEIDRIRKEATLQIAPIFWSRDIVCPACLHQWSETQCLSCSRWSPHSDWYAKS